MSQDELERPQSRATTPANEYHWYLLYQLIRGLEWLRLHVQSNDPDAPVQQLSAETKETFRESLDREIEETNTTDNLLYAESMKYEDRVKSFPQESWSHDLRLGKFRQQQGYNERLERFRREWTEEAALERIAELFAVWTNVRKRLGLNEEARYMVVVREHMLKTVAARQAARKKATYSLWPKMPEAKVMEKRSPK
ncbi:hypothetical protein SMACR_02889 [Sordaria macrospora]|uniref:WGS project CABT00000000 data, contig 2.12 n=2 Tax=Sordaria macrospora TaxID=5147 RepID=F7VXR9_SORMK|nr:uncharacterized protein SMAC_02889 [Sordaria macrospora k-hell]KAA8629956.1 hypothetical protein SMACR_02889 [Sordaria macrospora]KAH7634992.1 hypothetical protein B0T09DRAFT_362353 [Sordaria sp. MPI-SDFR-AT-0083]WPJ58245.1 hypothetical protein SMAC4_02889 [Sordaria macrospora]CCC10313.1 unnamed protein product [Sordaria macrospora k-hell]